MFVPYIVKRMSGGLLQRICKREEAEPDSATKQVEHRQIVRGILAHNEEFRSFLDNPEETHAYFQVSIEPLNELKEVECFDSCSFDGRRAIGWANRHSENVEVYIQVTDMDDEFCVKLEYVGSTNLTNEMISDFADSFHRSIASTFDPLGEEHEEPRLVVRPW